jgi:hypothetical protein
MLIDAEFAFDIFAGVDGLLDSLNLGKWLRCLNVNPSLARMEKFGVGKKAGS